MKKLLLFIGIILFVGCDSLNNTPTRQVEIFLNKYQTLDKEVLDDLDSVVAVEESFNSTQRDEYKETIKSNYKKMSYKVKDEEVQGDKATVTVEIEVVDYSKVITDANKYLEDNPTEFEENGEYNETLFVDYKLDKLKEAKDTVKYTLELKLTKTDKKWNLDDLPSTDIDKINGIYMY